MKRLLSLLLVVLMLTALCACGAKPGVNGPTPQKEDATTTTTEEATTTTTTEEGVPTTTTTTAGETTSAATSAATSATTAAASKTEATKAETTSSTRRPMATPFIPGLTTTTTEKPQKTISILAVGNSFSVDAMKNHLYPMLQAAGYDSILLGNLYVGGCSLDSHYSYISRDSLSYEFQINSSGSWSSAYNAPASRAFNQTNWDIITVQQASPDSGNPESFGKLESLLSLIKSNCRGAKIYWHMTWAYQQDSTHDAFPRYGSNQLTMYNAIVKTVREKVANNSNFRGVIPCGTSIQNLRTSTLGDTLTADGYHLKDTYGDYTAALTWYCMITGKKADTMTYRPTAIADHFDEIAQAVDNAIAKPYQITSCK